MDKFQLIKEECLQATTNDPIVLLCEVMNKEYINIHGPEHHVLDGSCLLTAIYNTTKAFDLNIALDEMIARGSMMPGATCGKWGVCGSVSSLGAAMSIIHGTGPLSNDDYYKDHLNFTSQVLSKMSLIGGPRCCKRNAFISMQTAIDFIDEHYDIKLPSNKITCTFSPLNKQCIGVRCPYFGGNHE